MFSRLGVLGSTRTSTAVVFVARQFHPSASLLRPSNSSKDAMNRHQNVNKNNDRVSDNIRHENAHGGVNEDVPVQSIPYDSDEGDNISEAMRDLPSRNEGNYPYRGLRGLDEPFWKRDYLERRHEDEAVRKHDEALLDSLWKKNKTMTEKYWTAKSMLRGINEGPKAPEEDLGSKGDEIAEDLQQVEALAEDIEKRLHAIDAKLAQFERVIAPMSPNKAKSK